MPSFPMKIEKIQNPRHELFVPKSKIAKAEHNHQVHLGPAQLAVMRKAHVVTCGDALKMIRSQLDANGPWGASPTASARSGAMRGVSSRRFGSFWIIVNPPLGLFAMPAQDLEFALQMP